MAQDAALRAGTPPAIGQEAAMIVPDQPLATRISIFRQDMRRSSLRPEWCGKASGVPRRALFAHRLSWLVRATASGGAWAALRAQLVLVGLCRKNPAFRGAIR